MSATLEACLSQLEALLKIENAALARMDVGAVAALTSEKSRIVETLRKMTDVAAARQQLDAHDRLLARVSRTSDENKELLERAMRVQRRMLAMVASACHSPVQGYGRKGGPAFETLNPPRAMLASA